MIHPIKTNILLWPTAGEIKTWNCLYQILIIVGILGVTEDLLFAFLLILYSKYSFILLGNVFFNVKSCSWVIL